ncbi:Two pore calcium channel protein 2 [Cichlidogyrus casuarinus]|uniref:Two pore calcium channel protein 2 n=1 Tax=Cichlidogyrus casuarinus TaxID=1844966 RepID=A0ABD2PMW0_9PLAT
MINYSSVFVAYFLAEQVFLIYAHGIKSFFKHKVLIFDLVTAVAIAITKIAEGIYLNIPNYEVEKAWTITRVLIILMFIRSIRLVYFFNWTRELVRTFAELPRNLNPILVVLYTVYYVFALLGMSLFKGKIVYDKDKPVDPSDNFATLGYYSQNFDDFASSIVILWNFMIVNNWFIVIDKLRSVTSNWAWAYFLSFWAIVNVMVLSLFTALVIDTFMNRRSMIATLYAKKLKNKRKREAKSPYGPQVVCQAVFDCPYTGNHVTVPDPTDPAKAKSLGIACLISDPPGEVSQATETTNIFAKQSVSTGPSLTTAAGAAVVEVAETEAAKPHSLLDDIKFALKYLWTEKILANFCYYDESGRPRLAFKWLFKKSTYMFPKDITMPYSYTDMFKTDAIPEPEDNLLVDAIKLHPYISQITELDQLVSEHTRL